MKKRRNWIYKNSEIRLAAIAVERAKESMMKTGRIVFFLLPVPLASEAHILQPKTSHGQTITTTTSTWLIFKRQEEDKNENSSLTRLEWERKTGFLSHRAGVEFFLTFFSSLNCKISLNASKLPFWLRFSHLRVDWWA